MPTKKIVLKFPPRLVEQPIIYKLVKDFDLEFNILKANIMPDEEGLLVLELTGDEKKYNEGIKYLKSFGILIQPLSKDVVLDKEKCTHCGACVTVCPVGAFTVDEKTRKIVFDNTKCIACELCINACPLQAMELHF
ncbi:MAG: 4Fe-4S dicluster domain-containing protein [Elusimicrobia bacterium]|nr:4Fe-4S dicluster domain-containing protein [Elusimicrobiota bacterium]